MANAIPLLEGTDASGGYLVRPEYGETLVNTINRRAAAWDLSSKRTASAKRQQYAIYAGRPTASFVGEGAEKPVTGAEYSEVTVDIKKLASTVLWTEELLEDAQEDPTVLVGQDVEAAIADTIDAHCIGQSAGAAITSQFNNNLVGTTSTVEFDQARPDALAVAVSQAMAVIEGNGGIPSGVLAGFDTRAHMRDARGAGDNAATPLYLPGFAQGQGDQGLFGLPIRYTTNLRGLTGAAGAGKVVAIVGDFSHSVGVMRRDLTVRFSTEATVNVSGTLHHLWQQNKTAAIWETRVGYFVHDLNRMFVAIVNAS
jgi:HK97 family phage major capsid protein